MSSKENSNHNEIALNLNALCIEIGKKATGDQGIKDFENIQNLIVNSIIMATIYTLNIAQRGFLFTIGYFQYFWLTGWLHMI